MELHFVAPDLRRLDELRSEAIALAFFADDRPLVGALGLVDWRLCGHVSRLIQRGRISGARGERLLVAARPKLPFDKLFLFGLGQSRTFDEDMYREGCRSMFDTLARARVRACVCALPGRAELRIGPERAMDLFLEAVGRGADLDEVTLVEDADAARVMGPVVERDRRRARAAQ